MRPLLPAHHFADVIGNPDWRGQAPRTQRLRHRTLTRAAGRDGMSTKTGARRPGRRRRCTRCDGWLAGPTREHQIAEEQAALRRVAVLVARAAPPGEVFTAVTEEAGRLLAAGHAAMSRYDPDGAVEVVAAWSSSGAAIPVGTRMSLGGRNVHTLVFEQGRAARLDDYAGVSGAVAEFAREFGIRAAIGVPISVEGRLWGLMSLASTRERPLPADTEVRLAGFTELRDRDRQRPGTGRVTASRARIVAPPTSAPADRAGSADGAQQRLVSLAAAAAEAHPQGPSRGRQSWHVVTVSDARNGTGAQARNPGRARR